MAYLYSLGCVVCIKEALHVCKHAEKTGLPENANGIGWGFGDFVGDVVGQLEQELDSQ